MPPSDASPTILARFKRLPQRAGEVWQGGIVRFPLWTLALPESIEEIRLSDNSSFWDQGYRALMLTDTSFLRNPNYHQASDTPDTLDYERMAQVTVGIAGGAARLAGLRRPRFAST